MADLEELILKTNVPGRYSRWTEEQDDFHHGREEDDDYDPNKSAPGDESSNMNSVRA